MTSLSLLPVILSSPNDPTVILSCIGAEDSVDASVAFGAIEVFIDIPGPVVDGTEDDPNVCESS
jgi:hypothetical protein